MRTYARIDSDVVAELFTTSQTMSNLFHQHLLWIDVTASPEVRVGWTYDGDKFKPPAPTGAPVPNSLVQVQAQLMNLTQQVAALAKMKP